MTLCVYGKFKESWFLTKKWHGRKNIYSRKLYFLVISLRTDRILWYCIYFEIPFLLVAEVIVDLRMSVANYDKYLFTSFQKLQIIISIIIPMGKAAIMLTVWILLMELSETTNAVGSRIRRMHHNS